MIKNKILELFKEIYFFIDLYMFYPITEFWQEYISCRLFPRQKWIKKYIEYYKFSDKVELIPNFLFGCIIEFVESEKAFDIINYDTSKCHREFADEIKKVYNYIKIERPEIISNIDILLYSKMPAEQRIIELDRMETMLNDSDKQNMKLIVKHSSFLWT